VAVAQNYFQQDLKYTINVSLDDKKHELTADERIEYTNNSPDTLTQLYFHLWANAYKNTNTLLAQQFSNQGDGRMIKADDKDFGYIDHLDFKVNDKQVEWALLEDTIDICVINLHDPLPPHGSITITTSFHVKIPSAKFSRLGHVGESYMISQWYPKPAVYDRNGWNYFPYLDQGEFYSEFGTFDVFITLPQNYVVGATGDLVDGEKELQWLDDKVKETEDINPFSTDMSFPKSSDTLKTLHYHQERVHDFAWFADKRWHVLKGEIEMPSKHKVTAWAMFTNKETDYWKHSIEYISDAVKYYSEWAGEYPYNNVSAIDATVAAGGGMEYPNITAIGNYGSAFDLEVTIAHEVGHNWFYGMLGSNERRHPWMDEGINQFCEMRYVYTKYANDSNIQRQQFGKSGWLGRHIGLDKFTHRYLLYFEYLLSARTNTDQPSDLLSEKFSLLNYQSDVYAKTSVCFDYLKSYLGDSLFDKCMNNYFEQWKFKHPMPEDIKKVFENTSGKNLDWLFDDLLFTSKKIDYKVSGVKCHGGSCTAKVTNKGKIDSPVSLTSINNGKIESTNWFEGFEGTKNLDVPCSHCDEIRIDGEEKMPEANRTNNISRTKGMLRTFKPLKPQWLGSMEDAKHSQIFFTPVVGWNNYNKFMAGGAVYNIFIPEKKFEYLLMPMYSFGSKNLAGGGRLSYSIYPYSNSFSRISFSVGAQTYSYDTYNSGDISHVMNYRKVSSSVAFSIINRKENVDDFNDISLRNVWTQTEEVQFPLHADGSRKMILNPVSRVFNFLYYTFGNHKMFNPYSFRFTLGLSNQFFLSSVEYNQTISYTEKGRGFDFRIYGAFAGKIEDEKNPVSNPVDYHLHVDGQSTTSNYYYQEDYLYDEVLLGRSEDHGILSQQFASTQGGFKVATGYIGASDSWLAALNIKTVLPGKLPLKIFADIGGYAIPQGLDSANSFLYDFGIELILIPKICSVYFPLGYSSDIKKVYENELYSDRFKNYGQRIRFELNLSQLNPFELRKHIAFLL
jgi:hypothetical protein